VKDLVSFYRAAKKEFDSSDAFQAASRAEVVALQSGDTASLAAWNAICEISRAEFKCVYDTLAVNITERGESFYNPQLKGVISDLKTKGLLSESNGALCVFIPGFTNR
jgi:arginyl-tRNA synthetase